MSKKAASPKKSFITVPNGLLLSAQAPVILGSLHQFLAQPLPILAMMDLKMAVEKLAAQLKVLNELKLAALKKHGATETKPGSDTWTLPDAAPGFPAFVEEMAALAKRDCELPFSEKIKLRPTVRLQDARLTWSWTVSRPTC